MIESQLNMTPQEFDAFLAQPENNDRRFELVDGESVEKIFSTFHKALMNHISGALQTYLDSRPIATLTSQAYHPIPGDTETRYQSDIAVTGDDIISPETESPAPQMPDLIIEVKSPSQTYKHLRRKADAYLTHGATLVWVIIPAKRLVEVYRAHGDLDILTDADTLDGEGVLPGFQFPVYSIFDSTRQTTPRQFQRTPTALPINTPLIPPNAYPLHPWWKGKRQKVYHAISPALDEMPAQRWPIQFTVYYFQWRVSRLIWSLIAVLTAIFILMSTRPAQTIFTYGLNTTSILLKQEYYRMLTFSLLHIDIVHLVSNVLGLWLMGRRLEPPFGLRRLAQLLFFSTLFTGMIWTMFSTNSFRVSVGASAMVYTLLGAALMHIQVNRKVLGEEYMKHFGRLLAIIAFLVTTDVLANTMNSMTQIDVLAHAGGFISGAFIAWWIAPRMRFTIKGLYGVTVQAIVEDDNPPNPRSKWLFIALSVIGLIILMVIQRQRWPSVFS